MSVIRKDENPQLWKKLNTLWKKEKKRGYVVGPGGVNYKVLTPGDHIVIFKPMAGIDGQYSDLSGGIPNVK